MKNIIFAYIQYSEKENKYTFSFGKPSNRCVISFECESLEKAFNSVINYSLNHF